jgi:hypothetical protein
MSWNSTLKRGASQLKRSPMARSREKKGPGLAQRIAESLGKAIQHARGESNLLRSETHRKNVAALACAKCGIEKFSQAAHPNFDKGGAMKTCDSLTFPLCCDRPGVRGCHSMHDQGGIYTKQERPLIEWEHIDATRAALIRQNKWTTEVEAHYQRAIQPLVRVVHE